MGDTEQQNVVLLHQQYKKTIASVFTHIEVAHHLVITTTSFIITTTSFLMPVGAWLQEPLDLLPLLPPACLLH